MSPVSAKLRFYRGFILTFFFTSLLFFLGFSSKPRFACDPANPSTRSLAFCETSLPIDARVQDLISRLSLDEKISQLGNTAPAIPRLGIPSYQWWSESLHGVSNSGPGIRFNGTIRSATSFPQVILTAASFDSDQWFRIGQAIGMEARAIYNAGQAAGMTFWAPNINIFRDPRWGRGQETPGEDPTVAGKYAAAYVRGLQGDSDQLRASACCKHFTAYDLDFWKGMTRFDFNAAVSVQDLADTYQPPFQSCIEQGRASGIMCSYNRVNGVPNCANFNLLSKTARERWGFQGYITSDCDAVSIIHDDQNYASTPEDAVRDVLIAGMDVNCGSYLQEYTKSAIEQKKVKESDINRALHNLFSIRLRLGLFNGNPKQQPFGKIDHNQVCSAEHQKLALDVARNGIVLLKNSAKLLPLSRTRTRSLAIIGPNADNPKTLLGNYAGPPCKTISPLQALKSYVKSTQFVSGCDSVACSLSSIDQAVEVTRMADHVILIMGLDQSQESEGFDRENLVLPGQQQKLITSVARAARAPVVLVLLCGGPVDVSFAKYDPKIGSILWAGYPGEAGGTAIAEIIFGDHNPGGKLPITWYPQSFTQIPMTNMRMRPDRASGYPGRSYRFYEGKTVYKFGFGLSYTSYSYQFVSVTGNPLYLNMSGIFPATETVDSVTYDTEKMGAENCSRMKLSAIVRVNNQGGITGRHPVLLFVRRPEIRGGGAIKQLVGFKSIELKARARAEIEFALNPCDHLSRVDEEGKKVVEIGSHFLAVGDEELEVTIVG